MSKRVSLREFQEGLAQRLKSAAHGYGQDALLGIQSGREFWLLQLSDAGEIVPLPPLMKVPLTKPWFAGIANIRGTLYSVVDFSAFQGGEPTALNSEARLLLVGTRHGINSAILVSRTLGLKKPATLNPTEETNRTESPTTAIESFMTWRGSSYSDAQGTTWRTLHIKPLLSDGEFLNISR